MTPHRRLIAARVAYIAVVLVATLTHLGFVWDRAAAAERLARALAFRVEWSDAIDGLRNVALFAGLGAVWVVTSRDGNARREVLRATLAGVVLSATVEGLQCFSPLRTASFMDVGTNTLGALAGAAVVAFTIVFIGSRRGERSYFGVPMALLGGAYAAAALCEALTPLFRSDVMPDLGDGPGARLHAAFARAFPLSVGEIPLSDVPLFVAAGFLIGMIVAERRRPDDRPLAVFGALAGVLVLGTHVAHGLFGLPIRWEAVATDVLAVLGGSMMAQRGLGMLTQTLRGAARARVAIGIYMGLLVLWGWRPFLPEMSVHEIVAQFGAARFIPLSSLADRADVFSAVHVAQQFLLYLPLGAMLAVWPLRSSGRWKHLWPGVWLSLAVELGHVVVHGRFFDVTNVLIACAGLSMGWIVVRRSGFIPYGEAMPTRAVKRG